MILRKVRPAGVSFVPGGRIMAVKSELSLSELQKKAGEIRRSYPGVRQISRLGHLEIAALLFRLNPGWAVWSSSFSLGALYKLYQKIGFCEAGPILQRPQEALGFSAGLALAASVQQSGKPVCCCMSDMDQLLGGVWEAAIRSVRLGLGNLLVFVADSANGTGLVADRYAACGWNVLFMNAANMAEGYKLLAAHKMDTVPSVIITRVVMEGADLQTPSAHTQREMADAAGRADFHELMHGLFRGIATAPGASGKAVFLVDTSGSTDGFPALYVKTGEISIVDCGPAAATAVSLAAGFGKSGGTAFVAHRGRRSFSLSGGFPDIPGPVRSRQVEYPHSALEAEAAVLRLLNLMEPWKIRIRIR